MAQECVAHRVFCKRRKLDRLPFGEIQVLLAESELKALLH
jgi:hypothetical protein